jgi:abnormal spindle-like microcephaly-associated protein
LVEIFLFSPNRIRTADMKGDATVTIQMPDLTVLESALCDVEGQHCPRILSQHLKMPCLGRVQKVHNVQVAISALRDHGRREDGAASGVTAEDIVDGHREKTLSLLWALVSNHGLDYLIDFIEIATDIQRASDGKLDIQTLTDGSQFFSQLQQESLLRKWASAYCDRKGVKIGNLTTSFADGKAYATIVEAFLEKFDLKLGTSSSSPPDPSRLEAQLHALGCSTAFIKQLTGTCGTIPSRKTTISNLAFLASRLLPLARQNNAAVTIQRAFRLRRSRVVASQRVALMRLAHACATIVQTQKRLVSAAVVLQRAWRDVLDKRINRLNSDVEQFQAVARTWTLRKKLERGKLGLSSDGPLLWIRGGW